MLDLRLLGNRGRHWLRGISVCTYCYWFCVFTSFSYYYKEGIHIRNKLLVVQGKPELT